MNAVDTNVLIYSIDPRDPRKQRIARGLLEELEEPMLLWQVAVEYLAAARKLEATGVSRARAWNEIERLRQLWPVAFPQWSAIDQARELLSRYSLSFWDAMLVAACATAGVQRLYSEDLTAYPRLAGVELVNPFRSS